MNWELEAGDIHTGGLQANWIWFSSLDLVPLLRFLIRQQDLIALTAAKE